MRKLLMASVAFLALTGAAKAGDLGAYVYPFTDQQPGHAIDAPRHPIRVGDINYFVSLPACPNLNLGGLGGEEHCLTTANYTSGGTIVVKSYLVDCADRKYRLIGQGLGTSYQAINTNFTPVNGSVLSWKANISEATAIFQLACIKNGGVL